MLRRAVLSLLVVLGLVMFVGTFGTAWLIYQPEYADSLVAQRYEDALVDDPGHASLYIRAFDAYFRLTRANTLHYVVHELAARVATLTGHGHAAAVQRSRASFHRPEHGGALISLLVELRHGFQRLWHRLL